MQPSAPEFRTDINGLRAYAVIGVLLYHFGLLGFASGFVGVDVFFVISGFLMASLIAPKLTSRTFSLSAFYAARLRRILPALVIVCAVLLMLGWFWLGPTDYEALGNHAASAVSFISNFTFNDEDGYFDAPSRDKWLLHSWSLSVEAQFYLLFPLLLLALNRFVPRARNSVLWIVAILSYVFSILYTPQHDAAAFYLLPSRAWELLAGSLLYLYPLRPNTTAATAMEWVGMALIVASMFLFDQALWPGAHPFWPVLGTLLVLAANKNRSWLTGNRPMQSIGLWSYSIYLWHWPLIVGLTYAGKEQDNDLLGVCLALSIALGAASYSIVEQPAQRWARQAGKKRVVIAALAAIALIVSVGLAIAEHGGVPTRVAEPVRAIDAERHNRADYEHDCGFDMDSNFAKPCVIGNPHDIGYVLWGDSHAGSIAGALAASTHRGVYYYTYACATVLDTELRSKGVKRRCRDFNRSVLAQIDAMPRDVRVVVANRYAANVHGANEGLHKRFGLIYFSEPSWGDPIELYQTHLRESLCRIAQQHRLYAIKPQPEMGIDVPRVMVRRLMTRGVTKEITLPLSRYEERNREVLQALDETAARCPNVTLLDPVPYLCPDGKSCMGSQNGLPLYIDDDHVSERGNRLLLPMFKKAFQ